MIRSIQKQINDYLFHAMQSEIISNQKIHVFCRVQNNCEIKMKVNNHSHAFVYCTKSIDLDVFTGKIKIHSEELHPFVCSI